jgi:hypothetical protein
MGLAHARPQRPFYVLGNGPPQVVVGRYADVDRLFSDIKTFKSEVCRAAPAGAP